MAKSTLTLVKKDSNVSTQTKPPHISSVASSHVAQPAQTVETPISAEVQAAAIVAATETLRLYNEAAAAAMVWTTNPNIIELQPFMSCLCREIDFEEALTTPYSQIYVKTGSGYLKHMKLKGNRFIRLPIDKLPGKVEDPFGKTTAITEQINFLPAGKIPFKFYNEIVEFFRAVMRLKKSDIEAHAWILWEEAKGYYISIPKQTVSKASVNFTYDDDALPKGAIIVVDIHSHNTMGAFYSGTDNNNDKTGVYYSGVVGKLTEKSYEWVMRFNHYEQKKAVADMSEIFDMDSERPQVPEEWLDKVQIQEYKYQGQVKGSYFPKGGNTTPDVSRMGKGSGKSSNEQSDSQSFSRHYTESEHSLWDDLHSDKSFEQFFGERPTGRTLMPNAKPNAELRQSSFPALGEKFLDWQKRQEKIADELLDEEFDRSQMRADLAKRNSDNRGNYYETLQQLAVLNAKVSTDEKSSLAQSAEQEQLEAQLAGYVTKMTDDERKELGLSEEAEAFLERYYSNKEAPKVDNLDMNDGTDNSNWPYSAISDAYGADEELFMGKGNISSERPTEEDGQDTEGTLSQVLAGVDAENCDFPDGDDFNTVAAEYGVETANSYAIVDMLLTDLEGYDAGLLEVIKTAFNMLSSRGQAIIQTNGLN